MNIIELTRVLGVIAGGVAGFHFVSPFGTVLAILAVIAGAVAGFYVGMFIGLLFILPFEGMARLCRFLTTGHWIDPQFKSEIKTKNKEDQII